MCILRNGVVFENEYPMINPAKGICKRVQKEGPVVTSILDYKLLQPDDEENLKLAVALIGPISASIKVAHKFLFYQNGISYDLSCNIKYLAVNHAVLLVGYGTDPVGGDFWIIQNNWGPLWGEGGFARIARNTRNNCGIAAVPIFPVTESMC